MEIKKTKEGFNTILFGFAFSPTLNQNITEVTRVAHYFDAELILMHVGAYNEQKEGEISRVINKTEYPDKVKEIIWKEGDPYSTIKNFVNNSDVDLLVLGAQQHETLYRFYVGSVARKLTRHVNCSVLLLINPSIKRKQCQHIVVNGLDNENTSATISQAFFAGHKLQSKQITVVEEIQDSELKISVEDDSSLKQAVKKESEITEREDKRVHQIINDIPKGLKKEIQLKTQSIFGRRGYSLGHYAEVVRADLLVINAPKNTNLFSRIFTRDIEFILSDLPTDLLIVRAS
ncbi:MAG: universal stress protein UspA [Flavobacteriaceae bacterium]|nr:universal stress protein UspA [Flavobacteriaceae bacterium]